VGIFGSLFGGKKLAQLSVDEVAARLGGEGFFVIDNNGPGSWQKRHVPGAKNLDPGTFGAADLPTDKMATLVFYCSGPL
jgi:rhodanese-related sulfurtransferase